MADPISSRTSARTSNTSNPNARLANPALTQGGAYVLLGQGDLVVSNDSVTAPMWSDNNPNLTFFILHQLKYLVMYKNIIHQFFKQLQQKYLLKYNLM